MTIHRSLSISVAALAGALFVGQPAFAQTELVYGSWPPAGEYLNRVALPKAFAAIEKETKGQIKWKLVPGGQLVVRGVGSIGEPGAAPDEVSSPERTGGSTHDDQMAAIVTAGFQEDGIHRCLGSGPGCARLDPLGAADLGSVRRDHRVVRHVLRLERGDPDTSPSERATEGCRDDGLARVRSGAGDEQTAADHRRTLPTCQNPVGL